MVTNNTINNNVKETVLNINDDISLKKEETNNRNGTGINDEYNKEEFFNLDKETELNNENKNLIIKVLNNELNNNLYKDLAIFFTKNKNFVSQNLEEKILKKFINFDNFIFVNEIYSLLNKNKYKELKLIYEEKINKMIKVFDSKYIFEDYNRKNKEYKNNDEEITINDENGEDIKKNLGKRSTVRKKRNVKNYKKESKQKAIENFKTKRESKIEKRKRYDEVDRMMRKQ